MKGPAVGLFADQEIRMIEGPLFVGEEYVIRRRSPRCREQAHGTIGCVRIFDASGESRSQKCAQSRDAEAFVYAGYDAAADRT